jgi:hypothetical protein
MAYVYRHIRLDKNEPFYIGVGNDTKFKRAKEKCGRTLMWNRIVSKHGYKIDIIMSDIDRCVALEKEIEFIKLYGRRDLGLGTLINMTDGGEDGNLNHVVSKETREKHRILSTGRIPWNKGLSGYTKIGTPVKESVKQEQRLKSKSKGAVVQYTFNGEVVGEYLSCTHASKVTGINGGNISRVVDGYYAQSHGFVFKFKGEPFQRIERLRSKTSGELYFTLKDAIIKTNSRLSVSAFTAQVDKGISDIEWIGKRKNKPKPKVKKH